MNQFDSDEGNGPALEKAAKYICTMKCGLCPMVVENFTCHYECTMETRPWKCWMHYFTAASSLGLSSSPKKGAERK